MTQKLANNINSLVGADDKLWCLGDWSFGGIDNVKTWKPIDHHNKETH